MIKSLIISETIILILMSIFFGYCLGKIKKSEMQKENEIRELKNEIEFMEKM